MYQQRPSQLRGAFVWSRSELAVAADTALRILPDGCLDLLCIDGTLQVAGPDSRARLIAATTARQCVAVRFPPGLGGQLLGISARQVCDEQPLLDQVWDRPLVRSWERALARSATPSSTLESLVLARSQQIGLDRWPRLVTAMFADGADVGSVATELGWGARRLHRRSLDAFGYPPSLLRRILRLQRAVRVARTAPTLAVVAAACGYSDQPHLAREFRALAGVPLSQLP